MKLLQEVENLRRDLETVQSIKCDFVGLIGAHVSFKHAGDGCLIGWTTPRCPFVEGHVQPDLYS